MKFRLEKKEFERLLDAPSKVASKSASIAVLKNVLIELSADQLRATASNGSDSVATSVRVSEAYSDGVGVVCVDAAKLVEVVGAVRDSQVDFEVVGGDAVIRPVNGRGRFTLPTCDYSEFPLFPAVCGETYSMPSDVFSGMLSTVSHAMSTSNVRSQLCSVCMDVKGGRLTFVATNGHVLSMAEATASVGCQDDHVTLIPSRTVPLLSRVAQGDGEVVVTVSDRRAAFACGGTKLSCVLAEGKYPNYRSVIPPNAAFTLDVERQGLLDSLQGVMSCSDGTSNLVVLDMKEGLITLRAENTSLRTSGTDIVLCSGGGEVLVGVNGLILASAVRNIKVASLNVRVSTGTSPLVFSSPVGEGYTATATVMPMRIG